MHYMGNRHFSEFDVSLEGIELKPGDRLLLCTDGLDGTLDTSAILKEIEKSSPAAVAEKLTEKAVKQGGEKQDNVTVQVITVTPTPRETPKAILAGIFFFLLTAGLIMAYLWPDVSEKEPAKANFLEAVKKTQVQVSEDKKQKHEIKVSEKGSENDIKNADPIQPEKKSQIQPGIYGR